MISSLYVEHKSVIDFFNFFEELKFTRKDAAYTDFGYVPYCPKCVRMPNGSSCKRGVNRDCYRTSIFKVYFNSPIDKEFEKYVKDLCIKNNLKILDE